MKKNKFWFYLLKPASSMFYGITGIIAFLSFIALGAMTFTALLGILKSQWEMIRILAVICPISIVLNIFFSATIDYFHQ